MNGDDRQVVDTHGHGERSTDTVPPLRQLGEERLSLGGGRSVSWLSLQVILFFVACLICVCCSISSYAWSSVSRQLTVPASLLPRDPSQTVTHTPAANRTEEEPEDAAGTEEFHTPAPTWTQPPAEPGAPITPTQTKSSAPTGTLLPTEPGAPTSPAQTPTPGATSQSPIRTPTPVPEPTAPPQTPEPSRGPSDVHILTVEIGPLGVDAEQYLIQDLEQEHIVIENRGTGDQDMTGWTLNNDELSTYRFPNRFLLRGGATVRVWTKSGEDTDVALYWGSDEGVWDNESGVAYLRNRSGTLIDALDW